ncbi:MAG: magnesium transporter, partial [Flavobacteriales bacterium]|nr:magnesium transporter [Flavobacteriales bacterium]
MTFTISKANLERLQELVAQQRDEELLEAVRDIHPADLAEILDQLDLKEAQYLFERLEPELAAEVVLEVPEDRRDDLLGNYTGKEIAEELIEHFDSDDAADMIAELSEEVREEVLANIEDQEQRKEINELLTYDERTAGGLMAKELVKVHADSSMLECVRELRRHADLIDDIYVILVVDDHDRLVGSIPLKALLTTSLRTPVKEVYDPDVISIKAHEDVEEVNRLMEKYDLVMLPVTDDRGRLLGRITIDDVVDAIREEETEDAQRMAGMGALEYSYSHSSLWEMVKKRSGWLVVLFIGESFTATAMGFFMDEIERAV